MKRCAFCEKEFRGKGVRRLGDTYCSKICADEDCQFAYSPDPTSLKAWKKGRKKGDLPF